jgi:hypothetical protein
MPELTVGQAGKELTHNQALAILDQIAQAVVVDKDLATPPGSPANGALYIVAAGATGAWAGQSGKLAFWLTSVAAWTFITPTDGWSAWVTDEAVRYERKAGAWVIVSSGGGATLPVVQALTSTRSLALVDINTFNVNSTTNNYTVTIPAQGTVAWTADAEMHFLPSNTGDIVVTAAAGVSLNGVTAASLTIATQNGAASLKRTGADSWWIGGVLGSITQQQVALELVKQTSTTDTTAGSLLINGAHGLGLLGNATIISNIDDTANNPSGMFRSTPATTGTKPTGAAANGTVLAEPFSGTIIKQSWTDVVGGSAIAPRKWDRTSYALNTWGAWTEVFNAASTRLAYGIAPYSWGATYSSIDLGDGTLFSTAANFTGVSTNLYNDGTNWRYKKTSTGIIFGMIGSLFNVTQAASGTAGTLVNTLGVDTAGNVIQQNPAGTIGYGTGAGGTVTQVTNKATGVTLNKPCGQITMNAASLAANTAVSFTLTNSVISAVDNITVNIQSGAATGGSYTLMADAVAAGSCRISLRNLTGGALAETIVINFQINKTVTA